MLLVFLGALAVLFHKAQKPFWAALVPFYNIWVLSKLIYKPVWGIFTNMFAAVVLILPLGFYVMTVFDLLGGGMNVFLLVFSLFMTSFFLGIGIESEVSFGMVAILCFFLFYIFSLVLLYALMAYGSYCLTKKFGFGTTMAVATAGLPFFFLPIVAWKGSYQDSNSSRGLVSGNTFPDSDQDLR